MDTRNFTLSSSNISDRYTYNVSIKGIECIEDLIDRFSGQVNSFLLINSTPEKQNLFHGIKENLHIHDTTLLDIINARPDKEFYICDHCSQ
jgi:hypothetical protein|tara:strand:- start:627 stop:899 length:273 start_codon:yes stop_codon:yes gene_type:complete